MVADVPTLYEFPSFLRVKDSVNDPGLHIEYLSDALCFFHDVPTLPPVCVAQCSSDMCPLNFFPDPKNIIVEWTMAEI